MVFEICRLGSLSLSGLHCTLSRVLSFARVLMACVCVLAVNPHDWLPNLVSELVDAIRNCNKSCIICNKPLEFVGLKPAVCADPLCTFSHMQFGLGEDVIAALNSHPEVIDLLISLTSAAAGADITRFNPFPAGVEVTYREEGTPHPTTLSFMTGPNIDTDRDGARIVRAG